MLTLTLVRCKHTSEVLMYFAYSARPPSITSDSELKSEGFAFVLCLRTASNELYASRLPGTEALLRRYQCEGPEPARAGLDMCTWFTPEPTPEPTPAPTPVPTPHPCDDGHGRPRAPHRTDIVNCIVNSIQFIEGDCHLCDCVAFSEYVHPEAGEGAKGVM